MRIPSHTGSSEVNGQYVQPTRWKIYGYQIQCGKCSRIAGITTQIFDGKLGACVIGFLTPPLHGYRACLASEEVREASLDHSHIF